MWVDVLARSRTVKLSGQKKKKTKKKKKKERWVMARPECCVPAPPSEHACAGREDTIGPFTSYVVASPASSKAAVVLASDVLGFEAPLLRKLADKIAGAGYYVVVPDFFNKDPFVPGSGENAYARVDDWLKNHMPLDAVEGTKQVVEGLKNKGFQSVGAAGFCWGAKVVVELAKEHVLKAAVLCHPSFVTVEDIQDVKTPIAILAAEFDSATPASLAKQFGEILESKTEVESFAHIYPGVHHGWTNRYDINDKVAVERAEEAHAKILEWFGKFLS